MEMNKVGEFIKELRKQNHLTQADLARKYGVTYQAVSKWENGQNYPDITLLKEISKDFNVNIEDILSGELNSKKKKKNIGMILSVFIIMLIAIILFLVLRDNSDFSFKTISATCKEFKVSGSIAYDNKKSAINISKINYCGGDDNTVYDTIECELYEEGNDGKKLISKCNKKGLKQKLEDYLQEVEVNVSDYKQQCKNYTDNSLFLEIKANIDNKTTIYKVDLSLNNCESEENK